MSNAFAGMQSVRTAFAALQAGPADAAARAAFRAEHEKHREAYVESFEVAGATYPRTDGHRLSESQARQAIDKALSLKIPPEDLKPGVLLAAYPLPDEVLRHEIEATVQTAEAILRLNWQTDTVASADRDRVRELLRMPTVTGGYAQLRSLADKIKAGAMNPYRAYQADHLIPDKALRGVGTVRDDSPTKASSFATFLQDGQNKGSQHKFATDGQNFVVAEFKQLGRNPSVEEYLDRVFVWMSKIYTRSDLVIDGAKKSELMSSSADFALYGVKGYAIAQAGFMTWPERETVGKAIATALLIEARQFYASIGWDLGRALPLVHDIPNARSVRDQALPPLGGATP